MGNGAMWATELCGQRSPEHQHDVVAERQRGVQDVDNILRTVGENRTESFTGLIYEDKRTGQSIPAETVFS